MKCNYLVVVLSGVLFAACSGDGSGDGGGTEGTGGSLTTREILGSVQPTTKISELNANEEALICQNITSKVRELNGIEASCRVDTVYTPAAAIEKYLNNEPVATDTAGIRNQCFRAVDRCVATSPSTEEFCNNLAQFPEGEGDPEGCILDDARFAECNVTSGVVAQCAVDLLNDFEKIAVAEQCDALFIDPALPDFIQYMQDELEPFVSAACDRLFKECSKIAITLSNCDAHLAKYEE